MLLAPWLLLGLLLWDTWLCRVGSPNCYYAVHVWMVLRETWLGRWKAVGKAGVGRRTTSSETTDL